MWLEDYFLQCRSWAERLDDWTSAGKIAGGDRPDDVAGCRCRAAAPLPAQALWQWTRLCHAGCQSRASSLRGRAEWCGKFSSELWEPDGSQDWWVAVLLFYLNVIICIDSCWFEVQNDNSKWKEFGPWDAPLSFILGFTWLEANAKDMIYCKATPGLQDTVTKNMLLNLWVLQNLQGRIVSAA